MFFSVAEVASKLGCSLSTVRRAAFAATCGVRLSSSKRLVALTPDDVVKLRRHVHDTAGNPVWIANKGRKIKRVIYH